MKMVQLPDKPSTSDTSSADIPTGDNPSPDCVENWSVSDVSCWLGRLGYCEYVDLMCVRQKIDGKALLMLTEADLRQPPLSIQILGDIKRLYADIHQLQIKNVSTLHKLGVVNDITNLSSSHFFSPEHQVAHRRCGGCDSQVSDFFSEHVHNCREVSNHQSQARIRLDPEFWKTVISIGYFFLVTWITAIVMVIVHDRVPDMEKYPPLPDIFLDNVPFIPWAFDMCEITGCALFMMWITILIFHRHRCILLRRMFALLGSVFLIRCVTMLITSLSVPGRHLDCRARPYGDFWAKLYQAFSIWKGAGMAIQGVRSCGDYMFSGHTVILTMLNFCITEYTPRSMYYVHTISWVLNLFGIFFILAAHEHYSIDVFVAFYISTRLFLYYHTLANNRDLMQRDSKRTRIWFPLFSFFESRVGGIVPNEFESPVVAVIRLYKRIKRLATFKFKVS